MKIPRRNAKVVEQRGGLPPARLHRVTDYIQSHPDENLSLARMAELAKLSPYHFGRLFKQSTGLTPHQYVLGERIRRAKRLLVDTHLTITEVSRQLGFASRAHFTTAFRTRIGTTPKEYRLKQAK